jgi:nucleoid-associated protein YgaU
MLAHGNTVGLHLVLKDLKGYQKGEIMAHTAQHARKPQPSRFTGSQKLLALTLALIVIGMVSYLWLAAVTTGGAPAAHAIINHGLNPVTNPTTSPVGSAVHNAARNTAGGVIAAGVIAAGIKKYIAKHLIVKHVLAKHYIVKPGDTLWGIAKTTLHNPLKWHQLYSLNHAVIGADPNKIVAGQSLLLLLGEHRRPMA